MSKARIILITTLTVAVFNSSLSVQPAPVPNRKAETNTETALVVLHQAQISALTIKDRFQRDALLELIGVAQAKAGDLEAAIQTANEMRLPPIPIIDAIGKQLAMTNDFARAISLGKKLKEGGANTFLFRLAEGQIKRGDVNAAFKTVELIEMTEIRSYALEMIARGQAENADYAGARKTQALAANTYPPAPSRPAQDIEQLIVVSQISRGDAATAHAAITSMQQYEVKFSMLLGGSEVLWKNGHHSEAIKWIDEALGDLPAESKYDFFRYLAIPIQVKLEKKDAAMSAAAALPSELRVEAYMAVVVSCAEIKDAACVNSAAEQMKLNTRHVGSEDYGTKLMLLSVAAALIDNDQFGAAKQLLDDVERQTNRAEFGIKPRLQLQRILMLAREGKFAAARSVAIKMDADSLMHAQRGTALRVLTLLQTKSIRSSESLSWARRLPDGEGRSYALVGVAQALLGMDESKLGYTAIHIH